MHCVNQSEWVTAWHGTHMEALYAICYYGLLFASQGPAQGENVFLHAPIVYLHNVTNLFLFTPALCKLYLMACFMQ